MQIFLGNEWLAGQIVAKQASGGHNGNIKIVFQNIVAQIEFKQLPRGILQVASHGRLDLKPY